MNDDLKEALNAKYKPISKKQERELIKKAQSGNAEARSQLPKAEALGLVRYKPIC